MSRKPDIPVHKSAPPETDLAHYQPRTALGRRLLALRRQIVESGAPLLTWEEIEEEVAERRNEVSATE